MSLILDLSCKDKSFKCQISGELSDMVEVLGKLAPDATEVFFGMEDFGVEKIIPTKEAIRAIKALRQCVIDNKDAFGFLYQTKTEFMGVDENGESLVVHGLPFSTGTVGGFKFKEGEEFYYSVTAYANRCELSKREIGADGKGVVIEVVDIRDRTYLQTTSRYFGRIDIRKIRSHPKLLSKLRKIRKFLDSVEGDEIIHIIG